MKPVGIAMTIGGAVISLGSFLLPTSVHSEGSYQFGSYTPASDIINIGLLQRQELVFLIGAALFVAGAVLIGAGAIVEELRRGVHRSGTPFAEAAPSEQAALSSDEPFQPLLQRATPEEMERAKKDDRLFYSIFGVVAVIGVIALLVTLASPKASTSAAAAENSAAMLADNLEMQADNLEAMADNTVEASSRPRSRAASAPAATETEAAMEDPPIADQGEIGRNEFQGE